MLTQQVVQDRLNAIADEISRSPGMYYELYFRLFSQRIRGWIATVPEADASVIERVAGNDPDYSPDIEITTAPAHATRRFNPAWDMEYD